MGKRLLGVDKLSGEVVDFDVLEETIAQSGVPSGVSYVNGKTGDVNLTKADIGLGNVDNTSDEQKNIAVATLENKTIDCGVF